MKQYRELVERILSEGSKRSDRTGVGTIGIFGHQSRYDLRKGFPLLTLKKTHWKSIVHELLWFLSGDTNVKYLQENGITIWNEWTKADGTIGPGYGKQWRDFGGTPGFHVGTDQISALVNGLIRNPDSRRHIVTAWNPEEIDQMALPCCHCFFQCYVSYGFLDLQMYQRSADTFLGVPFNIASYSLLLAMLAQSAGLQPRYFIHTIGDAHLYLNHLDQAKEMLVREDRPLPTVELNPEVKNLFDFKYEDLTLIGYNPHPAIKAKVAV